MSMFYLIVIGLIVLSLGGLVFIAARKFPQASLIDTGAIPQEREARQKNEIVKKRIERMMTEGWKARAAKASPVVRAVRDWFRRQYGKILALERQMEKGMPVVVQDPQAHVQALLNEIESLVKDEHYAEAERKYIEIINIDRRNLPAYRGLGEVYMETKQFALAKETFQFLAKVYRAEAAEAAEEATREGESGAAAVGAERISNAKAEAAKMHYAAALACKGLADQVCVRRAMGEAVDLEPSNPKYLDLLLEACILTGDKVKAKEVFNAFREANPENQKLETLYNTIVAMPEPKEAWKVTKVKNRP